MSIVGCDYSSKFVDIVKLDEDSDAAEWFRLGLQGQDAFDRTRDVRLAIATLDSDFWDDVVAVGIEQPRGNFGVVHVARIQGAILSCIPRSLLVQPHNPAEWRKTVGLAGNASKDMVQEYASLRLEDAGWSTFRQPAAQDFYDAYCIALATRSLLEIGEAA